jgi:hypothetical protein
VAPRRAPTRPATFHSVAESAGLAGDFPGSWSFVPIVI